MKLEHKRQKILPFYPFVLRVSRYALFSLLLIIFSVFIGVVGYKITCRLSWLDSFYVACMILTGMGPVVEMNTSTAKIFSSFYALYSGVAFLSITAVFFAPIVHRLLHILHVENQNERE